MTDQEILKELLDARSKSYSPYSKFAVGAIILTKDGRIIKGANLENSAYGCSICAERTAMFQFKLLGYKKEDAEVLACIADTDEPVSPCGSCRQVMAELLAYHTPVYLYNLKGKNKKTTVEKLLPFAFSGEDLKWKK